MAKNKAKTVPSMEQDGRRRRRQRHNIWRRKSCPGGKCIKAAGEGEGECYSIGLEKEKELDRSQLEKEHKRIRIQLEKKKVLRQLRTEWYDALEVQVRDLHLIYGALADKYGSWDILEENTYNMLLHRLAVARKNLGSDVLDAGVDAAFEDWDNAIWWCSMDPRHHRLKNRWSQMFDEMEEIQSAHNRVLDSLEVPRKAKHYYDLMGDFPNCPVTYAMKIWRQTVVSCIYRLRST